MIIRFGYFSMWIFLFFGLIACEKDIAPDQDQLDNQVLAATLNLPDDPFLYAFPSLPDYLTVPQILAQDNTPAENPITDWGATLGRVLFYDKQLSINQTISCASCHKQAIGFSDESELSEGFNGGQTGRHSMSLIQAGYYPNGHFFWDERAATLEDQVLMPIQDGVEMGLTLDTLVARLSATSYYPILFKRAFGDAMINSERISRGLAQFVRSIISYRSKYDIGRSTFPALFNGQGEEPFPNFTAEENRGKEIFFLPPPAGAGCATCHGTDNFVAPGPRNNGLDSDPTDLGVGGFYNQPQLEAKFKVPSLRNVALTAPYMHDGRFATLEEVIGHYSEGIQNHPTLDPPLVRPNGLPEFFNFSQEQRNALIAFLHTLTDQSVVTEEKWTNPFK
ncbi:MAG: c-type cytochrome [Saprospiraceae bacterium]|nr:c-type cytochrome [Saprospiraceae bacterium]